jgi:hypothetical protein
MKLTAEQFADLAASFQPDRAATTEHERRRAARLELDAHVNIRMLVDAKPAAQTSVQIHDFSSRGIAIHYRTPLPHGSQFIVELQRQSSGCVSMLCTVMHCRQLQPNCYKIGAEFTCVLAEHPGSEPSPEVVDAELKRIRESMLD